MFPADPDSVYVQPTTADKSQGLAQEQQRQRQQQQEQPPGEGGAGGGDGEQVWKVNFAKIYTPILHSKNTELR